MEKYYKAVLLFKTDYDKITKKAKQQNVSRSQIVHDILAGGCAHEK